MKIDELEDLLSSIDNSVLDEYYHLFWGSKDYNRLKRIAGKLKYKGVADMFKLNLRGAYETHLDPRKFEETHFIKRFKILLQEVENADPFNWTPFMNYFYIRLNLKYCKRALSKSFSEILIEQKNQSAAEFLRDGADRYIAYKKMSGLKVSTEDLAIKEGMTKMIKLSPVSSQLIPTFKLGGNGDLIFILSNLLEERGLLKNARSFSYLFSPGQQWNGPTFDVRWNSTIGSLVYLFLLLIDYDIIDTHEHFDLNSKLCIFKNKRGKHIPYNSIKVELGRVRKRHLKDYPKNAKNPDFQTIYNIIEKVIFDSK